MALQRSPAPSASWWQCFRELHILPALLQQHGSRPPPPMPSKNDTDRAYQGGLPTSCLGDRVWGSLNPWALSHLAGGHQGYPDSSQWLLVTCICPDAPASVHVWKWLLIFLANMVRERQDTCGVNGGDFIFRVFEACWHGTLLLSSRYGWMCSSKIHCGPACSCVVCGIPHGGLALSSYKQRDMHTASSMGNLQKSV